MALPTMNATELGALPQITDPRHWNIIATKKVHFKGNIS